MAIKFEKIRAGMMLLDIHTHRAGNTSTRVLGLWPVKILSVDSSDRSAMVSWNGNAPCRWSERQLCALYVEKPPKYIRQEQRNRERWT